MTDLKELEKSPEELLREREQRLADAIHMRVPDRVPVGCELGYFVANYAGIPCSAAYYDCDAWLAAYRKALADFQPDFVFVHPFTPGRALELLEPRTMRWPGYGVDPYCGHQSIEVDGLRDDEYDFFLSKPADYLLRVHLPRLYGGLKVLSMLPELEQLLWLKPWAAQSLALFVTDPDVEQAFEQLRQAGKELRRYQDKAAELRDILREHGIPDFFHGDMMPPYDVMSHGLRGMKGTMLDMYRQPDKLLEACELIYQLSIERPLPPPNEFGQIRIFMTNTRGSDNFMSNEQFERFYWPTFYKLVMWLVEHGATPCIFFEGNFDRKLEYLLEFPKGSILVRLDRTDIFRAKEILGGHLCLEGNVPITLLQAGTPEEVKEHCKKLIDVVGKDGGFILSPRSVTDKAKPENLRAMIEFTKEYGRYS